jgi:hypothetical protein
MRKQVALVFCLTPILLTVLLAPVNDQNETYCQKTYGVTSKDFGKSIQLTSDGGYVVAGYTNSFGVGKYDVYLVNTDSSGNQLWQRTYGGSGDDYGASVQQTIDGGYIIVGRTRPFIKDDYDVYIVKTDASGKQLWREIYGGTGNDSGWSVQQTADCGYVIAGSTSSSIGDDVYLLKLDSSGKLLWQKTYGGANSDGGFSVQQTPDGGYVIAGDTWSFGAGGDDVYLVKTDASGNQLWQRTYGGTLDDFGYSVQLTSDGGYVIVGYTNSFGAGGYDVYFVKTDASGNQLWQKTYGGIGNEEGYSVTQTSDGGYVIAGWTNSFGVGGSDVYIVKTDASGNQLWQKTYGGTGEDAGYSVQQTTDGGYIIAGVTGSFGAGGDDFYLIKLEGSTPTPPSTLTPPSIQAFVIFTSIVSVLAIVAIVVFIFRARGKKIFVRELRYRLKGKDSRLT